MARLPIKCYLYSEKNKITVIVLKTEKSRIDAVDALRGFAVMAILLVHSLEHFIFPVYPASSPAWLAALDEGVFAVVFALFAGKAYAIFALLFGFTFHLQYASRQSRGEDFGGRFLWRLLLLVGFATLNAAFFPAGDVLLLFSLVGVVLFAVRRLNDRTVLALALCFSCSPSNGTIASVRWPTRVSLRPIWASEPCTARLRPIRKPGISGSSSPGTSRSGRRRVCCGPSMPDGTARRRAFSCWVCCSAVEGFSRIRRTMRASGCGR